jgi:hypothetical protein
MKTQIDQLIDDIRVKATTIANELTTSVGVAENMYLIGKLCSFNIVLDKLYIMRSELDENKG